jgi:3-oxoacyl-[acyl-carrier protein] reductase
MASTIQGDDMETNLAGRSVLITGATGGIGQAIARAFGAEGARVAVAYHEAKDAALRLAEELGSAEGRALAVHYALDRPGSPEQAVAEVTEAWGEVDILVANAMRWGTRRTPGIVLEDVPAGEWEPVIGENLLPTVRTVQLAVPSMRRRGWGRIVLISSHIAADGRRGQEFYGAAKAGLHGFARSVAWDLGASGILVNVVAPGLTLTRRVAEGLPEAVRTGEQAATPTGRLSSPEDVANAVVFLCSSANGNITGEVLTVSGGR